VRNPARILIADDNPANVRILSMRLAADGYDVVTARDGEEALAVAGEAQPDLILLDVMMPRLDGITVCRRLKEAQAASFTPIVLVPP
jgi:adenylate cyclase